MGVDKLVEHYDLDVLYRAFPLHPEVADEGLSLAELFRGRAVDIGAIHRRMEALMAQAKLPWVPREKTYRTREAQELAAWAQKLGRPEVHRSLFRAYWVEGLNPGKLEALLAWAKAFGLPEEESREVLANKGYAALVDEDWARARRLGITGVPTYVCAGKGLVGAQPYEQLERLALAAGAKRR